MYRCVHVAGWALLSATLTAPAAVFAQAPPQPKPSPAPHAIQRGPDDCVNTRMTEGSGRSGVRIQEPNGHSLSSKLAQSNGVICPPPKVDPEMRKPAPGGGSTPVIPPPGTPGGDPGPQPK